MGCLTDIGTVTDFGWPGRPGPGRAARSFALTVGLKLCLACTPAHAQYIQNYFPTGVPGYDGEAGVTVQSRQRDLYVEPVTHIGGFDVQLGLDEAATYDSNVEARGDGPGSAIIDTEAGVTIRHDWSRRSLGLSVSVDDSRYLEVPGENHTDWTVGIGGGLTLGRGSLTVGYAHLQQHEISSDIAALATTNAVPYAVDDYRASWDVVAGRFTFTPNIDFQDFSFGSAIINGKRDEEDYRNRHVLVGGVTTRFDLGGDRSILLEIQGVQTSYISLPRGFLDNGSTGILVLTGLDYQATGIFRYQLLAGIETRSFAAAAYGSQTAPIAEASVIWTPTGLTTVTDTLAREIESPATADIASYTLTSNTFIIDHELRRNVLLRGMVTAQIAEYLHQGSQNSIGFDVKATWLISRNIRLSLDYGMTTRSGAPVVDTTPAGMGHGSPGATLSGGYTDNRATMALHVAL